MTEDMARRKREKLDAKFHKGFWRRLFEG